MTTVENDIWKAEHTLDSWHFDLVAYAIAASEGNV